MSALARTVFSSAFIAFPVIAVAINFECAFLQDKYQSGQANRASCSMTPDKVYSTKWHTPKANEHCKVDGIHHYEDLEDFRVNTDTRIAVWTRVSGLTEDAKLTQKKSYLVNGESEAEASAKVDKISKRREAFEVKAHEISTLPLYIDSVTGKLLDPPHFVPTHNLILVGERTTYYLYVPESSGHAILIEPSGTAEFSWINMRFGKCRMED